MAALIEPNQVGKREDLRDLITIVDAKNKPFLAMVPKIKKAVNMLIEWQADDYDTLDLRGVADGKDVDTFENAGKDRAIVANYCQKWRRTAMVGDIAENVSNVAGAPSEMARAIEKKFEEISRDIEATLCGTQGATQGTSSVASVTRGLGQWIHTTYSGTDDTQVPSVARPPAASVDASTGTTDVMTEDELRAVLRSVFQEYGKRDSLTFLAGTVMKQQFSNFTHTSSGSTDTQQSIRAFTAPISNTVSRNVTLYEGDFNDVEVHTSLLLAASTGSSSGNTDYGYVLPLEKYGLAFNRAPRVRRLEDQGGGPRAYIDAIAGLVSWSPRSSGKIILQ